jgi:hypothetical protein
VAPIFISLWLSLAGFVLPHPANATANIAKIPAETNNFLNLILAPLF